MGKRAARRPWAAACATAWPWIVALAVSCLLAGVDAQAQPARRHPGLTPEVRGQGQAVSISVEPPHHTFTTLGAAGLTAAADDAAPCVHTNCGAPVASAARQLAGMAR